LRELSAERKDSDERYAMSDQDSVISEAHGTGFAVLCDPAGLVKAMLVQDGEPCSAVAVGRSLRDSVDEDSRLKLEPFPRRGNSARRLPLGWEMNLPYSADCVPSCLPLSAKAAELIVAPPREHIGWRDSLTRWRRQRPSRKGRPRVRSRGLSWRYGRARRRDAGLFDGLSRLNNELAGLHRELAKSHTASRTPEGVAVDHPCVPG